VEPPQNPLNPDTNIVSTTPSTTVTNPTPDPDPTSNVPPIPPPVTNQVTSIPETSSEPPPELNLDSGSGKPEEATSKVLFNWVDLLAFIPLLLAIPMARSVGWWWTTVRAFVFWIAVVIIGFWFGDLGEWMKTTLVVPYGVAMNAAFLTISGAILGTTYVMTNRLIGHQKEDWKVRMNRLFSMIPGSIVGAALAVWLFMLLSVFVPTNFPMHQSWLGSKILKTFPSVQKVYQEANKPPPR
jgi:hypothetical protein